MYQITMKDIQNLKPYERNARTHSRKQIRQIAESIKAFGFTNPVLINQDDMIVAGHCRVEAAKTLGIKDIPTICLNHLSPEQVRAYIIADNRLAELSGWDKEILSVELEELLIFESNLDITLTGFGLTEIDSIIGRTDSDLKADNDVIEPKGPAITQPGDLWLLGSHRVLCGDATLADDFSYLMQGHKADMVFTDPPYNVDYETKGKKKHKSIANDALGDAFGGFLESVCRNILSVTDGAVYICMSSSELHVLQSAFIKAGGHWSTFLIWAKNNFTIGRSDYQRQYEPILYGWKEGASHHWCGDRKQGDIWHFDKPSKNGIHPTMKPVGLVMRAIRNSSNEDGIVLDAFLGSGTTVMAAERTKRICYGMELDPLYVDAIIRRWQNYTGLQAIHAVTGDAFNNVANGTEV